MTGRTGGVLEDAADADGARGRVDDVVGEVGKPLVWEAFLVGYSHVHGGPFRQERVVLAGDDLAQDAQHGALVHVEVGVHRVFRDDRGQDRLVLRGQVAERQVVAADPAVDGRANLAPFV